MKSFFIFIIDLVFPPSRETLELRKVTVGEIFSKLPRSPSSPFPFIISLFAYKDPLVSELISSIKNKQDQHSIELGGWALYEKLRESNVDNIILIPIPISKRRRRERGYNQCELLIKEVLRLDTEKRFGKNFTLLVRPKYAEDQKLKNQKDRLESSSNIFEIGQNIKNRDTQIIIIDDVATTGSTVQAGRDTLIKNGYTNVTALTLAH